MLTARTVDVIEEQYTHRGEAFFHVPGAGHEAVAALNPHLEAQDWLLCHYRDKALMLARGITPEMFFHSLFCKAASHSQGRQMSAHMCDTSLNILSIPGPVGNHALHAVGVAAQVHEQTDKPIVLCALGDGTTQEGEVLEAIGEAVRRSLPVLFLIENNTWSISTSTSGETFFSLPEGPSDNFYNMPIAKVDGRDTVACYKLFGQVVKQMRKEGKPAIIQMDVQRLFSHTNADDQSQYREDAEIQRVQAEDDPLTLLAEQLKTLGVDQSELDAMATTIEKEVKAAALRSQTSADPEPIFDGKKPLPAELTDPAAEYCGKPEGEQWTMLEAIRGVFRQRMDEDPSIYLYGQDIEDPKGDVFGLTRGLTEAFPKQVKNAPLAEATIVGTAIGRAMAGGRPVAFLQFADFLPLAFNQIISELGSMYWRTAGASQCPVIVMITCGGYRPGLGPFHAQTLEAIAAHTPGVDVFMPATAGDAAGLLNAAFDSGRPTLFFYPKSCLNDRQMTTSTDVRQQRAAIGRARKIRNGSDLTFVAWGNTVSRCEQAAQVLETMGVESTLIDLRSLSPWDEDIVLDSVRQTKHLVVAHEDNATCGFGAEILATVAEKAGVPVQTRRVVRADVHVPCHFANQLDVLPSFKKILTVAADLLDIDVEWEQPPEPEPGIRYIEAVGTSPSDERITVGEWHIQTEQEIKEGDLLATFEADKAAADLVASLSGTVLDILVGEGESAKVGAPLLKLRVDESQSPVAKPITQEQPGKPLLKRRAKKAQQPESTPTASTKAALAVGIQAIGTALGSRQVTNEDLLKQLPGKNAEDIFRVTGIQSRPYVKDGETVVSLGIQAAQEALTKAGVRIDEVGMILCSTGTPDKSTPSLACRILYGLGSDQVECQAHDISAACSGYLYGLQSAYDFLQSSPEATVLFVTSEVLSPLIDPTDFNTAIIFGDAATATVLRGAEGIEHCSLRCLRPQLSARGEPGRYLSVPLSKSEGAIAMDGAKVFTEGVRKMAHILQRACTHAGISLENLDKVVPHQANQRILNAVLKHLDLPEGRIYSNVENLGNTSSSTIPLCLAEIVPPKETGQWLGLTAFGGGFTFGACLLETIA